MKEAAAVGFALAVLLVAGMAHGQLVVAGELIVHLRAEDVDSELSTWPNRSTSSDSPGDFTAVNNGDVQLVDGVSSVLIDELNDVFSSAAVSPESVNGNTSRSIEVWAYSTDLNLPNSVQTMVAWGSRGLEGANLGFNFGGHAGFGAAVHWGFDTGWDGGLPSTNTWHHMVYVYDPSETTEKLRLYVDGVQNTAESFDLATASGHTVNIGAQNMADGNPYDSERFTGYIACVRVHTGALSATEVLWNYRSGVGDPIFSDGFETGDTDRWSAAVGR